MKSFTEKTAKALLRGNITAIFTITFVCGFVILGIGILIISKINSHDLFANPATWVLAAMTTPSTLLAGFYFTKAFRADIKGLNTKKIVSKVISVESVTSHEAGSAVLYIPILADLLPKLFSVSMREQKYQIITTEDQNRYDVPSSFSVKENDSITVYFGKQSELYLGCEN